MQRLPLILGAAVFGVLALARPAQAACDPFIGNTPAGSARIYDGTIGGEPARLALIFGKDGNVEGRYAFATSPADALIRGKIEPGGERMTLTERDGRGLARAVFDVVFPNESKLVRLDPGVNKEGQPGRFYRPIDPSTMAPSTASIPFNPGCGEFGGALEEGGASKPLTFSANRTIDHPQFGHLYAIAGVSDDEVVNRGAQGFRNAIAANDREEVVKHFRFPIARTIRGQLVVVENEKGMLARYDDFFPQSVRDSFSRIVPRMMQASEFGIMMAYGIWLDKDGYIISF